MQVLVTRKTEEVINKMIMDELLLLSFLEGVDRSLIEGYGSYLNFEEDLLKATVDSFSFINNKKEARRLLVIIGLMAQLQDAPTNEEEEQIFTRNLTALYNNCKEYSKKEIYENPFIQNIKIEPYSHGKYILDYNSVAKGEVFFHDNEYVEELFYMPSLGYCNTKFMHPCIRIENVIHHFVAPEVINKYQRIIDQSKGNILSLGLGIGYYEYMASLKEDVKSITIIENDQELIDIFEAKIKPQFENKEKIKIIKADPISYIHKLKNNDYDYCVVDITANPSDSLKNYIRLKKEEKRLNNIKFIYYDELRILLEIRDFVMMEILCDVTGATEYDDTLYDEQLHEKLYNIYKDTLLLSPADITKVTDLENIKNTILQNA